MSSSQIDRQYNQHCIADAMYSVPMSGETRIG